MAMKDLPSQYEATAVGRATLVVMVGVAVGLHALAVLVSASSVTGGAKHSHSTVGS